MTKLIQTTDPVKARDDLQESLHMLGVNRYETETALKQYDQALRLHIPHFTSSIMQCAGRHVASVEFDFRKLPDITITIDIHLA